MLRTAANSLKKSETIALSAQGEGYKNELSSSNSNHLYNVRLKQRSSLKLQIKEASSNVYAELIQDRNHNARIDPGEVIGRSRALQRGNISLKVEDLKRGTYFVQISPPVGSPDSYQLALSTIPKGDAASVRSSGYSSWAATQNRSIGTSIVDISTSTKPSNTPYKPTNSDNNYQYLQSDSMQSKGFLGNLVNGLFGRSIAQTRWNASFINRTAANVDKYDSYNFSSPNLVKDLGTRGKSGKTLARLNVDYGTRSPGTGVQNDNYAMQAWTRVSLKEGKFYQVKSDSNDGTRFFFRDRKTGKVVTSLNGDWRGTSNGTWTQLLSVPENAGGSFDFYVQYYERTGSSAINVALEEVQPTAEVTASTLNLRSKPSTLNNTPITELNSGTNLKILRKVQSANDTSVPDWYQVVTPDGRQGYVAAQSNLVQLEGSSGSIVNLGTSNSNSGGGLQGGNSGSTNNPPKPTGGSGSSDGKTSAKGVSLIKSFEGLRLDAYLDPVGIWTIGYGTTKGIKAGMRITEAQAETYLREDLQRFEQAVQDNVKVSLSSDQFSALVSFTYNVGEGALASSTLLRLLNQGDYQGAADQLLRWNKGDGQELPGLTRRRKAERAMFLGQDYTAFV